MPPQQLPPVGGRAMEDIGPTNNIDISNPPPPAAAGVFLPPIGARASDGVKGMIAKPTIDFFAQPRVTNADGSISTVRSISFEQDGNEILIPTVSDGSDGKAPHILSNTEAILQFYRTHKHMGVFDSAQSATAFAQQVHRDYDQGRYDQAPERGQTRGGYTAAELSAMGVRPGSLGLPGDPLTDIVKGAGKAFIEHATNVGDLARRYVPGLNRAEQAIGLPISVNVQANNPAQTFGKGAEDVAEVVAPSGGIARGAEFAAARLAPSLAPVVGRTAAQMIPRAAVQGITAAGQAGIQGGNPTVAGVIGAAGPAVGAFGATRAPQVYKSALVKVQKALGATKEFYKALGVKIAPGVLERGLSGSRDELLALAESMMDDFGQQIEAVWKQFGDRPIATQPMIDALEAAKTEFFRARTMTIPEAIDEGYMSFVGAGRQAVLNEGAKLVGNMVELPVVFEEAAIRHLTALQRIIKRFGPMAPAEHLRAMRQAWGEVVAEAGGFAHRAKGALGKPIADISKISAKREAYFAIRKVLLKDFPETTELNKEYSFWSDLKDVLNQTIQRTAPQKASLGAQVAEAGGAAMGAHHGIGLAVFSAKINKLLHTVLNSPRWQLFSGRTRAALAEALADRSPWRVSNVLTRMVAIESGTDEKGERNALRQATPEQLARAGQATLQGILSQQTPGTTTFERGTAQVQAWNAMSPDARHYMYGDNESGIASYLRAYSRRSISPVARSNTVAWVGPDQNVRLRYPLEEQALTLTPAVISRMLMTESTAKRLAEAMDRQYQETPISAGLAAQLVNAARAAGAQIQMKSQAPPQNGPMRNDVGSPALQGQPPPAPPAPAQQGPQGPVTPPPPRSAPTLPAGPPQAQ